MTTALARTADEVAAFLLGAACAGCDVRGSLLCAACRETLAPRIVHRLTPGGLPVRAALSFEEVPARLIRALKQDGMTVLSRPLGRALGAALAETDPSHLLVPVPTSRAAFRRRGYRVPELLVRRAGHRPRRLLLPARSVGDQRGLGRSERADNVRGSMRVAGWADAAPVVLVDDVTTSGATFDEAARVCRAAGLQVVEAVALAATPPRSDM